MWSKRKQKLQFMSGYLRLVGQCRQDCQDQNHTDVPWKSDVPWKRDVHLWYCMYSLRSPDLETKKINKLKTKNLS